MKMETSLQEKHIIPFWKRYGETLSETRERFLLFHPAWREKKFRYEGRLDPLAEGIILFVHGGYDSYLRSLEKTYQVKILWGVETDSLDVLGIPRNEERENITHHIALRKENLRQMEGCRDFSLPVFSSPHIKEIRRQRHAPSCIASVRGEKRKMCFTHVAVLDSALSPQEEIFSYIEDAVQQVRGDFRQEAILSAWKHFFQTTSDRNFLITTLSLRASSGAYVRSFVAELSSRLHTPASSLRITRVQMGGWYREDVSS